MLYEKRTDYPALITPKGVAVWPSLNTPDFKFKKDYGEYHAKIRVAPDAPGLKEFIAAAEKLRDEAYAAKEAELKREKKGAILRDLNKQENVVQVEIDNETGEETGFLLIRASMNAGGLRRKDNKPWSQKPDIFNAKGQKLKHPPEIGGGSEMKLSVRLRDYFMPKEKTVGVSFDLEAVQLITLKSFGSSRSADDYGFGAEDGDDIEDTTPPFDATSGEDIRDEGDAGDF